MTQIQKTDSYELNVTVTWLDLDQVQLKFTTTNKEVRGAETRNLSYYMTPQELAKLADHIDDCLCR